MKVKVFCKTTNWTLIGTLIKESKEKIYIWSNDRLTIEMHFPKHSHYYKLLEDAHNEK